jgi:hypothetical protein
LVVKGRENEKHSSSPFFVAFPFSLAAKAAFAVALLLSTYFADVNTW